MGYLNDPTGFWAANLAANNSTGIASLLDAQAQFQSDPYVKGLLLDGQNIWTPCVFRWNGGPETVGAIRDGSFFSAFQTGGTSDPGIVELTVGKASFVNGVFPTYKDVLEIEVSENNWRPFQISDVSGQFDLNDPALVFTLETENNGRPNPDDD